MVSGGLVFCLHVLNLASGFVKYAFCNSNSRNFHLLFFFKGEQLLSLIIVDVCVLNIILFALIPQWKAPVKALPLSPWFLNESLLQIVG